MYTDIGEEKNVNSTERQGTLQNRKILIVTAHLTRVIQEYIAPVAHFHTFLHYNTLSFKYEYLQIVMKSTRIFPNT